MLQNVGTVLSFLINRFDYKKLIEIEIVKNDIPQNKKTLNIVKLVYLFRITLTIWKVSGSKNVLYIIHMVSSQIFTD